MVKRIGLLGAAKIAPKAIIAPVKKRSDCEIVAVGCRNQKKGLGFVAEHVPGARVTNYKDICSASDIDIVYCALPPSEHLEWVSLAVQAGKAVLCEKPFSMGASDAKVMAATAKSANVPLMEAFHYYFHPAFQSVLARFRSGEFGKAIKYSGRFSVPIPNRDGELRHIAELGGGALMDLGCYPLHAARQLLGEPDIVSVDADIQGGVDVALTAQLSFGHCNAEISCDMRVDAPRKITFQLDCERGTLWFDNFVHPYQGYEIRTLIGGVESVETGTGPITYDAQLEAFMSIVGGGQGQSSVEDAVLQMQSIEAIYAKAGLR